MRALAKLGRSDARCMVWLVDDDQALLLLATLNRLQGYDDPSKRAALVAQLADRFDVPALATQLPEQAQQLESLLALNEPVPVIRPPQPLADMPVAVHFFLLPDERSQLEKRLRQITRQTQAQTREQALMHLITSSDRFTHAGASVTP